MWLKRQFLRRASTAFLHDVVMAAVSFVAALYLRLGDALFEFFDDAGSGINTASFPNQSGSGALGGSGGS